MTGTTPVCGWGTEPADNINIHVVPRKHVFIITSELIINLEKMFRQQMDQ